MVTAIISVSILLTVFYAVMMRAYRKGWRMIDLSSANQIDTPLLVSVIIPARNEEDNISKVLECLQKQDYPKTYFEIIVADDHSDDLTVSTALAFGLDNLRVIELGKIPGKRYKKAAITEAVKQAKGEIIITTDADCTMGKNWLRSVVSFFVQNEAALVSGPVVFDWDKKKFNPFANFFLRIQQLEFAGLVCIGGAALQLKFPNMCNGANLAYRKQVFDEVGGYMGNDNLLSGDDEFLMHKVFKKYPRRVHFLKNPQAVVKTPPSFAWGQFLGQRMRWVSKSTKYSDKRITTVLAMAYLFNLSILVNGAGAFFCPFMGWVFLLQILIKAGIESVFYRPILNFFGLKPLQNLILPAQPFHIAYVLMIGILGNFGSYNWKGRKQ